MTTPTVDLATLKADIAAVEQVVALIEKYDALLPIPENIKTGVADLDALLKWVEAVL